jgi:hypothetical protein
MQEAPYPLEKRKEKSMDKWAWWVSGIFFASPRSQFRLLSSSTLSYRWWMAMHGEENVMFLFFLCFLDKMSGNHKLASLPLLSLPCFLFWTVSTEGFITKEMGFIPLLQCQKSFVQTFNAWACSLILQPDSKGVINPAKVYVDWT